MRRTRPRASLLTTLLALLLVPLAGPAQAAGFGPSPAPTGQPATTDQPQHGSVTPTSNPAATCSIYTSSSGFGALCSSATGGRTLAELLRDAGIDLNKPYCWDDPQLPDGFVPPRPEAGPGAWYLQTCLSFRGAVVKSNARLDYAFVFHAPGQEHLLSDTEQVVIDQVTGRGQIPYLQVQTSPVSSPRVGQDVAFSLLCDSAKVSCVDTPSGRRVRTPSFDVLGVQMFAELVYLRVLPLGVTRPEERVGCDGAGLARTAEQLDTGNPNAPGVCRYRYERSSNQQGQGQETDRYPAKVTAYWRVFVDDGSGPVPFRSAYEKSTTNSVRVTEVQTLVVS